MKHIQLTGGIMYPFGAYINANLPDVLRMKDVLMATIDVNASIGFWCRGSSGAMIAAMMCNSFPHCVINHVKKSGENAHVSNLYMPSEIVVIIDDFMASGETLNAIYAEFKRFKTNPWRTDVQIKVDYLCLFGTVEVNALHFVPEAVICDRIVDNMFKTSADDSDNDNDLQADGIASALTNITDDDYILSTNYLYSDVTSGIMPTSEKDNIPP